MGLLLDVKRQRLLLLLLLLMPRSDEMRMHHPGPARCGLAPKSIGCGGSGGGSGSPNATDGPAGASSVHM